MASRKGPPSAETKFLRGQTGVDGAATDQKADPAEVEQAKAREALYRGRTWLGREALTWVLWKSESADDLCDVDGLPVKIVFTGKLLLRAAAGEVTEVAVKGVSAAYSTIVRQSIARGILVHGARLSIEHGEQSFEVTLDAEFFDIRAAKLPELLQEEEAEQRIERLELVARLGRVIDAVIELFIKARVAPSWKKVVVPQLKAWLESDQPRRANRL
jgi:hypothetical protein